MTVWQNLLISDIPDTALEAALEAIGTIGLDWACIGAAWWPGRLHWQHRVQVLASDTKRHAAELAEFLDAHVTVDQPLNIHLTGCHHSCAQHFVADIGLLATKVEQGDEMIEGYDLHVGGGAGARQAIGRLIRPQVRFAELPPMLLSLLTAWLDQRDGAEDFQSWTARQTDAELAAWCEQPRVTLGALA